MNVVLGNFLFWIASTLGFLLTVYSWIVIIGVLLTWVNPDPRMPVVRFIYSVTEPVLHEVRRRLPFVVVGGLDLSPIVVLLAIQGIRMVVIESLIQFSRSVALGTL